MKALLLRTAEENQFSKSLENVKILDRLQEKIRIDAIVNEWFDEQEAIRDRQREQWIESAMNADRHMQVQEIQENFPDWKPPADAEIRRKEENAIEKKIRKEGRISR